MICYLKPGVLILEVRTRAWTNRLFFVVSRCLVPGASRQSDGMLNRDTGRKAEARYL